MDKSSNKNETTKTNEQDNSVDGQKKRDQRLLDTIRFDKNKNIFLITCVIGICLAIALEIINAQNRRQHKEQTNRRTYWVYSAYNDVNNRNGLLKHVHLVLDRVGYENVSNKEPWNLLWSHDYPFRALNTDLQRLTPNQKVNHFPGTGFITSKVDLATTESKFIPKAFKIPQNKDAFLKYSALNKDAMFLEKHNQHRGVYLKNVTNIDLSSGESFVQEYVQKPFLVDGHKFDIGVYVVLTSVNPLRAYWYKGDVLFRYCPAKYYPFDPENLDKYVVGDDYLPTWEVPSLAHPYTALGFSMKDTFDHYASSKGKNVTRMWEDVQAAITEVLLKKEHHVTQALKRYPSTENFFEMMRFDLVVDEDLRVYLLEANMSPNLSSAHFPPNQLLYEQVLYNLYSITGVASHIQPGKLEDRATQAMVSSQKNVAVWSDTCSTVCKDNCVKSLVCGLCKPCMSSTLKTSLLTAHKEFLHRGDFRRLFPPKMVQNGGTDDKIKSYNKMNQLLYLWYQGKCNMDITWCS